MQIHEGHKYCGTDARPKIFAGESEGIEGEIRTVISIHDGQAMFQRRHGPPEIISIADFEAWAVDRVGFFLGRWAIIDAD